jgi:hypothetical protein
VAAHPLCTVKKLSVSNYISLSEWRILSVAVLPYPIASSSYIFVTMHSLYVFTTLHTRGKEHRTIFTTSNNITATNKVWFMWRVSLVMFLQIRFKPKRTAPCFSPHKGKMFPIPYTSSQVEWGYLLRLELQYSVWTKYINWRACSMFGLWLEFKYLKQLILPSNLLNAGFLLGWFSTLKMEVIRSSETSVHIRITRRYIPENGNIHNYFYENLKSCILNIILYF